jgi:hypothetical protein
MAHGTKIWAFACAQKCVRARAALSAKAPLEACFRSLQHNQASKGALALRAARARTHFCSLQSQTIAVIKLPQTTRTGAVVGYRDEVIP